VSEFQRLIIVFRLPSQAANVDGESFGRARGRENSMIRPFPRGVRNRVFAYFFFWRGLQGKAPLLFTRTVTPPFAVKSWIAARRFFFLGQRRLSRCLKPSKAERLHRWSNDTKRNVVRREDFTGFVGFGEIVGDYADIGERLIGFCFRDVRKIQIALDVFP